MKRFCFGLIVLLFQACGNRDHIPYEDISKQRQPKSPPTGFEISSNIDIFQFERGVLGVFDMKDFFKVPDPGAPLVKVEGLPEGASFNNFKLQWKPPCDPESSPAKTEIKFVEVLFTLKSSVRDSDFIQRRSLLVVSDRKKDTTCGVSK